MLWFRTPKYISIKMLYITKRWLLMRRIVLRTNIGASIQLDETQRLYNLLVWDGWLGITHFSEHKFLSFLSEVVWKPHGTSGHHFLDGAYMLMNSLIYWFLFDPQEDMSHINLLSNKAVDLIMAVLEEEKPKTNSYGDRFRLYFRSLMLLRKNL